jgi:hypothetical protein
VSPSTARVNRFRPFVAYADEADVLLAQTGELRRTKE